MPYLPTKQVIDLSQIADNLLGYVSLKQVDALVWAQQSSGVVVSGAPFVRFYTNASGRLQTEFPSLMILSQESETDISGDALIGGLQLTLEATISGSDADDLVLRTKVYAKAVESMLANIPSATLTADSNQSMTASLFEIETRLDILRGQQKPSAFLQIFQVRCVYRLIAEAF